MCIRDSGLPTDAFFFGGFLPVKSGKKNAVLQTAVDASQSSDILLENKKNLPLLEQVVNDISPMTLSLIHI